MKTLFQNLFAPRNLWQAAAKGSTKTIEELVAKGHNVNEKMERDGLAGETALHSAARSGQAHAICKLVSLGARIDLRNQDGETPLIAAAKCGHKTAVEALLELAAKTDQKDKAGMTALDHAAAAGSFAITELLIKRGATLDAGASSVGQAVEGGESAVLRLIIDAGGDVRKPGPSGPPLVVAALQGRTDLLRMLITAGADPNDASGTTFGTTPLMCAVIAGSIESVELLLQAGAEINGLNQTLSETALDVAETRKRHAVAQVLRARGGKRSRDLPDVEQRTAPPNPGTFWHLPDNSMLTLVTVPWPPKPGPVRLEAQLCLDDEGMKPQAIDCRVLSSGNRGEWKSMRPLGENDSGDLEFELVVELPPGEIEIQCRPMYEKETSPPVLEPWAIKV